MFSARIRFVSGEGLFVYLGGNRSHEYEQRRINALTNILNGTADIVVCSAEAAVQRTIPPDDLKNIRLR